MSNIREVVHEELHDEHDGQHGARKRRHCRCFQPCKVEPLLMWALPLLGQHTLHHERLHHVNVDGSWATFHALEDQTGLPVAHAIADNDMHPISVVMVP